MASMAARSNPEVLNAEKRKRCFEKNPWWFTFRCNSGCQRPLETAPKPYDFYHGVLIIAQFSSMANDIAPKCFLQERINEFLFRITKGMRIIKSN